MKKVIIIGGGIAGLSAGIYCLKNGCAAAIYEKNAVFGGECTGWDRQGYHIDNCIHWLTGCRPGDELYELWQEIGAIDGDTSFYREPYFYRFEKEGRALHFWRDIDRARREFLETAPEDSVEIAKFFDGVKAAETVRVPCEKSLAQMNLIEYMRFGMSMPEMGRVIREYGNDTIADLAKRFQNPLIQDMIRHYLPESNKAITLISSVGFYTSGTAAIPAGGSVGMARRIARRFEELGGSLHAGSAAVKINIDGKRAVSVLLADGSTAACDFVICATDPAVTFDGLLDQTYMDKKLRKMYADKDGYQVSSAFNASFGIRGSGDYGPKSGSSVYPCERYVIGKSAFDHIGIRMYDYDDTLFPKDRRVIQCNIPQKAADYEYWKSLRRDREPYRAAKQRAAETIRDRLTTLFPALADRLILLDTYSPYTFTRWCGAYKGAYMSFFEQKGYRSLTARNSVKGLQNVFVASQWLTTNGGLPTAAASGKFAAMELKDIL